MGAGLGLGVDPSDVDAGAAATLTDIGIRGSVVVLFVGCFLWTRREV